MAIRIHSDEHLFSITSKSMQALTNVGSIFRFIHHISWLTTLAFMSLVHGGTGQPNLNYKQPWMLSFASSLVFWLT